MVTAGSSPACSTRWIATAGTVKTQSGAELTGPRRVVQAQPVLPDPAGDHRDRRRRLVVVVKAGVLILAPADHPGVDVLVVPDLLVDADVVGVAGPVAPRSGARGQVGDEPLELGGGEAHAATACVATSVRIRAALTFRVESHSVRVGSTTGRSEP